TARHSRQFLQHEVDWRTILHRAELDRNSLAVEPYILTVVACHRKVSHGDSGAVQRDCVMLAARDLRVHDRARGSVDEGSRARVLKGPWVRGRDSCRTYERTECRIHHELAVLGFTVHFEVLAIFVGKTLQPYKAVAAHYLGNVGLLPVDHDADQPHCNAQ